MVTFAKKDDSVEDLLEKVNTQDSIDSKKSVYLMFSMAILTQVVI